MVDSVSKNSTSPCHSERSEESKNLNMAGVIEIDAVANILRFFAALRMTGRGAVFPLRNTQYAIRNTDYYELRTTNYEIP